MTNRNSYFSRKAALLDPACQVYKCGLFDWTTPVTFFMFNGWFYRFDNVTNPMLSSHPNFHRNLGVDRYTLIPAGTRILGTNANSFILGALPDQLISANTAFYADGETTYYSRMSRIEALPMFQIGAIRSPDSASDCTASFPPDNGRGLLISAITSHGGCWTDLCGGAVPGVSPATKYIVNTLNEINDAHEIRFTSGMEGLQPFNREWFDHIYLGLGTRGDRYGSPSPEATWCGVQGFVLPIDW